MLPYTIGINLLWDALIAGELRASVSAFQSLQHSLPSASETPYIP